MNTPYIACLLIYGMIFGALLAAIIGQAIEPKVPKRIPRPQNENKRPFEKEIEKAIARETARTKTPQKCKHRNGSIVSIMGYPVDPCVYKTVKGYRNVNVYISRCIHCGTIDIRWERTADTEPIPPDELDEA